MKLRKILVLTLTLLMVLSCTAFAVAETRPLKVALLLTSNLGDKGFYDSAANGLKLIGEAFPGSETKCVEMGQDPSVYESNICDIAESGYDYIIIGTSPCVEVLQELAPQYPDQKFIIFDFDVDRTTGDFSNVYSISYKQNEGTYIAGMVAGMLSESGVIGFIGGMELDTTKGKIAGFEEAAKYVGEKEGKTVELLNVPYANSFSDAPKGKEFATELISQGADVFFGDASAVDSGAREAIDAANAAAGEVKIYDIGQPADILGQNECIICSQVTDNSAMVAASMEAVEAGTFGGEVLYGTLQNGTLSAGALSDLVPADVQEKYLSYIEEMKNDTFMK